VVTPLSLAEELQNVTTALLTSQIPSLEQQLQTDNPLE
jgi:hypothetical protein